MKRLTPKKRRFVEEYLIDLNATQAAIRSGYKAKYARMHAARLMQAEEIKDAIAEAIQKRSEMTMIDAARVVQELAIIAFSDIRHYDFDEDGYMTIKDSAPDEAARAVGTMRRRIGTDKNTREIVYTTSEFKLWDKVQALKLLGQHLAMFTDKFEARVERAVRPEDLSDEELVAIAAQGKKNAEK